jgi:hypothetical protein
VGLADAPRPFGNVGIGFDSVLRVAPDGTQSVLWSEYANLPALRRLHRPTPLDPYLDGRAREASPHKPIDYYHLNTIQVLPETPLGARDPRFAAGNYLLCLRNVNLVLVLDRASKKIVWSWGGGALDWPHTPTMLADGRLLVFDNGTHRGFSRAVEVEPPSGRTVWEYRGDPPASFYSSGRGSAQRLPNGDTLICQSNAGRAFEVTPAGRVVWEYWNPVERGKRKVIYRMSRLPPEAVDPLLRGETA